VPHGRRRCTKCRRKSADLRSDTARKTSSRADLCPTRDSVTAVPRHPPAETRSNGLRVEQRRRGPTRVESRPSTNTIRGPPPSSHSCRSVVAPDRQCFLSALICDGPSRTTACGRAGPYHREAGPADSSPTPSEVEVSSRCRAGMPAGLRRSRRRGRRGRRRSRPAPPVARGSRRSVSRRLGERRCTRE
jgi:hypothetical protein